LEAVNTSPRPLEPERSLLDRLLAPMAPVRAGESTTAMILAANVFLLLGAYYLLKTVREPLILDQPDGALIKSRATGFQALLFLGVIPLYSAIASRFNRMKLIAAVTLFFTANLAMFYAAGKAGMAIGIPFFLWVGIFNMLVVAQFWAFANDVYTEEEGRRLFPIVGVGASLGAWTGSTVVGRLSKQMDPYDLMLLAAAVLCVCLALTYWAHIRESHRAGHAKAGAAKLDKKGGFQLVLQNRYLRLIALLVLLFTCVNSVGEYLIGRFVSEQAAALAPELRKQFIGGFYGDYYSWVNLVGFLMQTFLVSRLFQWLGVGGALFVLPLIATGGYTMLAVFPLLGVVRAAKILENATDYSLHNTVRHALFLPTSRDAKYKGKAAIDTFCVRAGDLLQTGVVDIGTRFLALSITGFAVLNLGLVALWVVLGVAIYREWRRLSSTAATFSSPGSTVAG
jgi:ATP:ADP antiporter, AAA family